MNINVKNKSMAQIRQAAEKTLKNAPVQNNEAMENAAAAEAAIKAAEAARSEAMTEEEFLAADKAIKDAEAKKDFYNRLIEHAKFSPRMDEKEYADAVNVCLKAAEEARDSFRKVANDRMKDICAQRKAYNEIIAEVNETLAQLDEAANILQSKHRCRIVGRLNMPDEEVEDANAWKAYTKRIDARDYFIIDESADNSVTMNSDRVYSEAWKVTNAG